jgi:hypothetical protein
MVGSFSCLARWVTPLNLAQLRVHHHDVRVPTYDRDAMVDCTGYIRLLPRPFVTEFADPRPLLPFRFHNRASRIRCGEQRDELFVG